MIEKKGLIIGIGVDIEDIERFRKLPFAKNKLFYEKIFTKEEIAYCLKKIDPYPHFAVRFCAKEAVMKSLLALGGALPKHPKSFHVIEIVMKNKKPRIVLRGYNIHISLSHDKDKAIAFAVILEI